MSFKNHDRENKYHLVIKLKTKQNKTKQNKTKQNKKQQQKKKKKKKKKTPCWWHLVAVQKFTLDRKARSI